VPPVVKGTATKDEEMRAESFTSEEHAAHQLELVISTLGGASPLT
jgi:hypothetical protein